jgi:hypothetical protein
MKARARIRGTLFVAALIFFCAGMVFSSDDEPANDGESLNFVKAVTTSRQNFFSLSREREKDRSPLETRGIYGDGSDGPAKGLFNTVGAGLFAVALGDLVTTEIGLSRSGMVELNPAQTNRLARVGTHVAIPALLWWMTERTHGQGKTKLALAMRIGFAIAYGYATLHNTRAMAGQP